MISLRPTPFLYVSSRSVHDVLQERRKPIDIASGFQSNTIFRRLSAYMLIR